MENTVELTFLCTYCGQEAKEVWSEDDWPSALVGRFCGECESTHLHLTGFKTLLKKE